jgi:hypothetical protein
MHDLDSKDCLDLIRLLQSVEIVDNPFWNNQRENSTGLGKKSAMLELLKRIKQDLEIPQLSDYVLQTLIHNILVVFPDALELSSYQIDYFKDLKVRPLHPNAKKKEWLTANAKDAEKNNQQNQ